MRRRTRSTLRLADVGEFGWIARLRREATRSRSVPCGLGDDAAVVRITGPVLVTTDALIEGIHFRRDWGTARQLGQKAFATSASDIAAMGGRPRYAVVDLRAPATLRLDFLRDVYRGFRQAAARCGAALVGGNTSRAGELSIGVTLLGEAPDGYVTRDRCRVGHDLWVTGTLGLAALGLRELQTGRPVRGVAVARFFVPPCRVGFARGLVRLPGLGGMIDVSDGCLQDLGHLCAASRVGAVVETECIPLAPAYRQALGGDVGPALTGGEDYELLFSARPALAPRIRRLGRRHGCAVTRIGRIVAPRRGITIIDAAGRVAAPRVLGHDHFRDRPEYSRARLSR